MLRILIIDDDEAIRGQVCFTLEKDHCVTEAGSYPEVEAISDISQCDIAIVDLGLPPAENSTAEGIRVIEYLLNNSPCKIIVLTGQNSKEAAMDSLKRGCFDFLYKPITMDKLLFSIERAQIFLETERELQKTGHERVEIQVQMGDGLQKLRETAEKSVILKVLNDTGFNVYKAAKILGIKRESLYYFIKKFNLSRKNDD